MKKNIVLTIFLSLSIFHNLAQAQNWRPYIVIEKQIESFLQQKYSKRYRVAVTPFDTLFAVVQDAFRDDEFLDPYGTLQHKMFFRAWETSEENISISGAKEICGFSSNGTVIWDSGPSWVIGGLHLLGSSDINKDGEVDVLVSMSDEDEESILPSYLCRLWIFSWNGTRARYINDIDPQTGLSTLLSGDNSYELFDWEGDGIMEIRALWDKNSSYFPEIFMNTRPMVTFSYNGSLYGLWPSTIQVPSNVELPQNRLSVRGTCSVVHNESKFTYNYKWLNYASSKQKIRSIFLVDTDSTATSTTPAKWYTWLPTQPFYGILWKLTDVQKKQMIKSGDSAIFSLQSDCLPSIMRYYVKGYAPSATLWEGDAEPSQDEVKKDIETNSFCDLIVAPKHAPSPFVPLNFLDTLSNYTTQSRSLGWIIDQATTNKYLGYFASAKTKLVQRDSVGARNILLQVLKDVDIDSTASLSSEAYALLRFNTEYLIEQLPAAPLQVAYVYQIDTLISVITQTQANGAIGDTAFVNSLNKQLSNARKNTEKGKITQAVTQINAILSRIEKAYNNTTKRQQQGKPLPKSFVLEQGWTTLSQQFTQLLQNLQSVGTTIGVPSQFTTIQAAIKAAKAGTTIAVEAGTYNEFLTINDKDSLTLIALDNAIIQGVRIAKSLEIIVKGFTIDALGTTKDAVQIEGTDNSNITVEANEIKNSSKNGIILGKNNSNTRIVNNVIVNNQKNGIDCSNGTSGAQYVINNTIVNNGYNGVEAASQEVLFLVNNIISYNGTAAGTSGGRYGVKRDANATAMEITLLNNIVIGNNGAVNKKNSKDLGNFLQILDGTDSQNVTTTGTEGSGITSSSAATQGEVLQTDFHLTVSSIAIDKGTTNFTLIPDEDKDGNPRIRRVAIDVGAYEAE